MFTMMKSSSSYPYRKNQQPKGGVKRQRMKLASMTKESYSRRKEGVKLLTGEGWRKEPLLITD
jgi:hypothetical protein